MPDIIDGFGIDSIPLNEGDLPIFEYPSYSDNDVAYTDPSSSFWADPKEANSKDNSIIIAKILRTNKKEGTMKVIGVHDDIYADVPIPSSMISSEQMGDVSQPAAEAQVVLAKMPDGDYVPIAYTRPYSDEKAYGTGVPNELEEGDLGWETKGGGKLYMFENGMLQIEAAPNCNRFYYPLDDGEKIQDMCREYNMVTDAGSVQFERRGIVDFTHYLLEVPELAGSNPAPISVLEMGALNDANTETGFLAKVYKSNVAGVTTDAAELKMLRTGQVSLDAQLDMALSALTTMKLSSKADMTLESTTKVNVKATGFANIEGSKINLGGETAVDPVPLGLKLQAEIEAIKAWCLTHVHVIPAPPIGSVAPSILPLVTPGGYLSAQSFVK